MRNDGYKKYSKYIHIATSELTQDAFIVWLMQWADKKFSEIDNELNRCAIDFVRSLIGESNEYVIETIKTKRQWNNIDVCGLVNDKYFVVINPKVNPRLCRRL